MSFKINILEKFNGSAEKYINEYIIPNLPDVKKTITFTTSVYEYLKDKDKVRYVRKYSPFNSRGYIYEKGVKFTVCDNEPALWFFMEAFEENQEDFESYEKDSSFPIANRLNPDEKAVLNPKFNIYKQRRENNFSNMGFKHCHILDCVTNDNLTIENRMLRLICPNNHFHFPSPRKNYIMPGGDRNDWGEDKKFRGLLKKLLFKNFYKTREEKDFFIRFLNECGATNKELDFMQSIDFNISFHKIENEVKPVSSSRSILQNRKMDVIKEVKNFILKESFYGRNYKIKFMDKHGKKFEYYHDKLLEELGGRITNLPCWKKYGYYTNSKKLPKFVEFLKKRTDKIIWEL